MALELIPLAGSDGQDGTDGTSATVAVGTVTTGAAGSSAAVSNAGTSSAAVLNFTIPRGATGAAGGYTSGPGYGSVTTLTSSNIVTGPPKQIVLPMADANFYINLNETLAGSSTYLRLAMPVLTESEAASSHWVRVTFEVNDRRREVGWQWWRQDYLAWANGSLHQGATVVEPGPEPGSISTITYEWIPAADQWVVSGYTGDAAVRRHGSLMVRGRSSTFTSALPAYASPELLEKSPTQADDCLTALAAIPTHVAAALGRERCYVDLAYTSLDECKSSRAFAPGTPGGDGIRAVGWMQDGAIVSKAQGENYEYYLKGFVMLHEVSHAVDFFYFTGLNKMVLDGTIPTAALDEEGWYTFLFGQPSTQISENSTVNSLWTSAKATGTLTSYYYNSRQEWFAQMLAVVLSARISGYDTGGHWTTVKTATQGTSTIYNDFVSFLQSKYIIP